MKALIERYQKRLIEQIGLIDTLAIELLASQLLLCAKQQHNVFLCGNGGSAGNANHLANDLLYGIDPTGKNALKVESLTANSSVLTCLGNDIGYENIFSHQLKVKGKRGDILIVLSGSGNSANILNALKQAKKQNIKTFALLGYSGGEAKILADHVIHNQINDMQVSEDLQLIVGHMLMQFLFEELSV